MGVNAALNAELCHAPKGSRNLITDVPGVTVGHVSLLSAPGRVTGASHAPASESGMGPHTAIRVVPGKRTVRTGVTAIVPPGDCFASKLPAAAYVSNGFGKSMGLVQVEELGSLETPILLTNTFSCGACFDALVRYSMDRHEEIGVSTGTVNPVVLECNDGTLNDIRAMNVMPEDGLKAIARAAPEFGEGDVGGGSGMVCFGLKGGIGSSSRVVEFDGRQFAIGVLVMSNFGSMECLRYDGRPIGRSLAHELAQETREESSEPADLDGHRQGGEDKGSIVAVVATDLPADSRQLLRLCKRVTVGITRCGGYIGNGSGEIVVAFSTANRIAHWAGEDREGSHEPMVTQGERLNENVMDTCLRAVAAASEESIISSLAHAHSVIDGAYGSALSLRDACRRASIAIPGI
ncbi:P1 family peptidase [Bifidobacterium sp.]|jgi:D-aminopeptidase|uniref:P1 family peptidase n=1 Tax=Bifidobacterium sp. TaxID=41200 RepID=UPI0025B81044|nr:P1 family peptidase [Bifidobacterium sp.]MCH4209352.1 P1 family peptidase [Bifidobacterium sp.]MCI1224146.1 P1 family peptidase [Bifidobacterium sp.]